MKKVGERIKNCLKNILRRLGRKTEKPREYAEVKVLVKYFFECYYHLVGGILNSILLNWYGVQSYQIRESNYDLLREAYAKGLVNDNIWMQIQQYFYLYKTDNYKELEKKIYKKIPEYTRVMTETIDLWTRY